MITGRENLLQSLIEAFLMEKGTVEFYSRAAVLTNNKAVRKAFEGLSEWETKHMYYIRFLYHSINEDREVRSFEQFEQKTESPETESGIPLRVLEEKIEQHVPADETEALEFALNMEKKAYRLYQRLSHRAEDRNVQITAREMMEQEKSHMKYLNDIRQGLVRTS